MKKLQILAGQIAVPDTRSFDDKCRHVRRVAVAIEKKAETTPDLDLVVLPELCTIEYSAEAFRRLDVLAEDLYGFSYQCFSELARKLQCTIAYGFARIAPNGHRISHAVVDGKTDSLDYYDKIHIAQLGASGEKPYFSPGNRLGLFDIGGFRVAVIICYDFRFPQLTALLSETYQPDIILHPVAFPKDATYESWHHFVICRAIESQAYWLSLNRAGNGWGDSIFCPPWIDDTLSTVTFGRQEELRTFTIDSETIAQVRATYPFARDRLSDYAVLKSR